MSQEEPEKNESPFKANDHLANERTYLAWVRTGIGIMAFGFVVVKFSLFVRQIGLVLQTKVTTPSYGYSALIGTLLVIIGMLSILFSFIQYRKTDYQLKMGTFKPSTVLTSILTAVILIISIILVIYLFQSI